MKSFFSSAAIALLWSARLASGNVMPRAVTPIPTPAPTFSSSATTTTSLGNSSFCSYALGLDAQARDVYAGYSTAPAVQCFCLSQLESWLQTSNPPTRTVTQFQNNGVTSTTFTTGNTTVTSSFIATFTNVFTATKNAVGDDGDFFWPGTAQPPCCSSCTISAGTVQLSYWPTPALPSQPTSFVSSGVTYISPSVYIGFTALNAGDLCGQVGKSYGTTTLAFNQDELSSLGPPTSSVVTGLDPSVGSDGVTTFVTTTQTLVEQGAPTLINYKDLEQNCSTIFGYNFVPGGPQKTVGGTHDPCHPTIVMPSRVRSVDPAWASCLNNALGGFYDPPFALSSASGLLPPSSTTSTAVATTAEPQQTPTTSGAASTTPPSPPQSTTPTADPSSSNTAASQPPASSSPAASPPASETPSQVTPSGNPPASNTVPDSSSPGTSVTSPGETSPGSTPSASAAPPANSPPGDTASGSVPSTPSASAPPPANSPPGDSPLGSLPTSSAPGATQAANSSPGSDNSAPSASSPVNAELPSPTIIGSQTLIPGGPAITASGSTFSIASTGGGVIVNGVIPTAAAATVPVTPVLIVGDSTILENSASQFVIGSQTLSVGGPVVTADGVTFSLPASGSGTVVVANGSTRPLLGLTSVISGQTSASTKPAASASTTNKLPNSAQVVGVGAWFAATVVVSCIALII